MANRQSLSLLKPDVWIGMTSANFSAPFRGKRAETYRARSDGMRAVSRSRNKCAVVPDILIVPKSAIGRGFTDTNTYA